MASLRLSSRQQSRNANANQQLDAAVTRKNAIKQGGQRAPLSDVKNRASTSAFSSTKNGGGDSSFAKKSLFGRKKQQKEQPIEEEKDPFAEALINQKVEVGRSEAESDPLTWRSTCPCDMHGMNNDLPDLPEDMRLPHIPKEYVPYMLFGRPIFNASADIDIICPEDECDIAAMQEEADKALLEWEKELDEAEFLASLTIADGQTDEGNGASD